MPVDRVQLDQLGGAWQRCAQRAHLLDRHQRVRVHRDQRDRHAHRGRVHAMQVDRLGQPKEPLGREGQRERAAVMVQIALDREACAAHRAGLWLGQPSRSDACHPLRGAREPLRELGGAPVGGHGDAASDGQGLTRQAGLQPEPHDLPLQRAQRRRHRMALVSRPDRDHASHALRKQRRERERDHASVGCAHDRVQSRDAEVVEQRGDRAGLVARVQRRERRHARAGGLAPAAQPVHADGAQPPRVHRAAGAHLLLPPPRLRVVRTRAKVAARRDAAQHDDGGRSLLAVAAVREPPPLQRAAVLQHERRRRLVHAAHARRRSRPCHAGRRPALLRRDPVHRDSLSVGVQKKAPALSSGEGRGSCAGSVRLSPTLRSRTRAPSASPAGDRHHHAHAHGHVEGARQHHFSSALPEFGSSKLERPTEAHAAGLAL